MLRHEEIDRMIHVPDSLHKRIYAHSKVIKFSTGRQTSEGAGKVIQRALDLEDLVRAGVLGGTCVLDGVYCGEFDKVVEHVREAHPGVIRGEWKK